MQWALSADAYGFVTVDPVTLLLTDSVHHDLSRTTVTQLAQSEYAEEDFRKTADLPAIGTWVARLSAAIRGDLRRCRRYREVLEPLA
jgi:hypothetical protein